MEIIAIIVVLLNMIASNPDYSVNVQEAAHACSIEFTEAMVAPDRVK